MLVCRYAKHYKLAANSKSGAQCVINLLLNIMQVQSAAIAEAEMSLCVCCNTTVLLYTTTQSVRAEAAIWERHR